jgi:hypothetical protein
MSCYEDFRTQLVECHSPVGGIWARPLMDQSQGQRRRMVVRRGKEAG